MAEIHPDPDLDGVILPIDLLTNLSLFTKNPKKSLLKKFPSYLVVKRFAQGEVICRQGEPGWTAYYILTPDDSLAVLEHLRKLKNFPRDKARIESDLAEFRERSELRKTIPEGSKNQKMATGYIALPRSGKMDQSMAIRMGNALPVNLLGPQKNLEDKTFFQPIGAAVDRNVDVQRFDVQEGQLFGEYSCLYRTPRGATIRATSECYMLEMLRNIFLNVVQKDPAYAGPAAAMEKKRFVETTMPKLSLFTNLTPEEYAQVKDVVELVDYEPGQLMFDENDRDSGVYVIRRGMVKELKHVSMLIATDEITDWNNLLIPLREGEAAPKDHKGRLWGLLPEPIHAAVKRTPAGQSPQRADQIELVLALNDLLKTPKLADHPEFAPFCTKVADGARGRELAAERTALRDVAKAKKAKEVPELPEVKLRRFNRLLLEEMFPTSLKRSQQGAPECILNYYSPGDYVCGYGVLENQPSNVTCIAFDHPDNTGEVQLVRLPGEALRRVCAADHSLREKIQRELSRRRKHSIQRLLTPIWDDSNQVQLTDRFEQLGLIQGQKLMLIDLDRCTRCDECVKACVTTHDDGYSRLFLDGPRFGKYLVPVTCRSCLDPVCMMDCPVSSIHRGDNREIVIEDWCIGCEVCAKACPYGSIQMHDLGVIKERSRGWRCAPGEMTSGDSWTQPKFADDKWLPASAPFQLDRVFRELLEQIQGASMAKDDPIHFRYPLEISSNDFTIAGRRKGETKSVEKLILIVTSHAAEVGVWLDGTKLPERKSRGEYEYHFRTKPGPADDDELLVPIPLRPGRHMVAVRVRPPVKEGAKNFLLKMGLYPERRPDLPPNSTDAKVAEELTEKLVSRRAVVCDLCSNLPGQSPACVRACPHDAAFRVNSRKHFPDQ